MSQTTSSVPSNMCVIVTIVSLMIHLDLFYARACVGVRAYVHACMCADVCVSVCPKLTCSNMKRLSILCSNI